MKQIMKKKKPETPEFLPLPAGYKMSDIRNPKIKKSPEEIQLESEYIPDSDEEEYESDLPGDPQDYGFND